VKSLLALPRRAWGAAKRQPPAALTGGAVAAFAAALLIYPAFRCNGGREVLAVADAAPNGGGYAKLTETGVSQDLRVGNTVILPRSASGRTYCCGFTLQVAMRVAADRGLLKGREPFEVKRFQREWYGATAASAKRQVAYAMESLGIGHQVPIEDVRPGDFAVFFRNPKSGHSVVVVEPLRRGTKLIGLRYRSSQPATDGVGDAVEYLVSSGYGDASIADDTLVVARLNCR
jgi:hypothetical protein